jgi:hypothetical protein
LSPVTLLSYGCLCDWIFGVDQKPIHFWRLRRQTALALIKIEAENQDLGQNASQSSNQRQQILLVEEENCPTSHGQYDVMDYD